MIQPQNFFPFWFRESLYPIISDIETTKAKMKKKQKTKLKSMNSILKLKSETFAVG